MSREREDRLEIVRDDIKNVGLEPQCVLERMVALENREEIVAACIANRLCPVSVGHGMVGRRRAVAVRYRLPPPNTHDVSRW